MGRDWQGKCGVFPKWEWEQRIEFDGVSFQLSQSSDAWSFFFPFPSVLAGR
jgi:hypothetical protein